MYLLYLDESGNPYAGDDSVFVLAGIAIFERQVYFLSNKLDEIARSYFPEAPESVEFHAREISQHREEPWRSLNSRKRLEVLQSVYSAIQSTPPAGATLFGAVVDKRGAEAASEDPLLVAFEQVCQRFDLFLARLREDNNEQRGLVVIDRSREEERIRPLVMEWRTHGTRFGRIRQFAEVPLFADSKATRLLQVADFVAYALYRRYEHRDTRFLDLIQDRFDKDPATGKLHGLYHHTTSWRTCPCPGCFSRRLTDQGKVIPEDTT
ncbi:MAG: DUF3800 domain-containing protein [Armatimonadetes bacterium]|nr:DUF3800 domain-containing protein [Armatimonadota bacterium]